MKQTANVLKTIFRIMEQADTRAGRYVDIGLMSLIFINIVIVVIDSMAEYSIKFRLPISIIEKLSMVVFSIEYILRLLASPFKYGENYRVRSVLKYIVSPMAIIDLLAILPFYLSSIAFDFRILRFIRLFRLVRILKIGRYSKALGHIKKVLIQKRPEIVLSFVILAMAIFFCGSLMYFFEAGRNDGGFTDIANSIAWTIKTMVFLGYADYEPISTLGRILGMVVIVLGLGWLTLPISILSSGFIDEIHSKKGKCPHCGKEL